MFYHYGRTCSRTIYKRLKFNMLESGLHYPSPSAKGASLSAKLNGSLFAASIF